MDHLKEFDKLIKAQDASFIAMCDMKIMEAEYNIEMNKREIIHYEEIKKIHIKSVVSPMKSEAKIVY